MKTFTEHSKLIKQLKNKLDFITGYNTYIHDGLSGMNKSNNDYFTLGFGFAQIQTQKKK